MNFGFDEEQKSLGDTVAQMLGDFPALTAPDPAEARDPSAWTALAELGLFSLLVPEADGGVGLSLVDIALAIEALGASLAPTSVASTLVATDLIVRFGTSAQKESWLPRIAAGTARIALAIQEAGVGYDPADITTVVGGNGVTGRKILVADGAEADMFLVLALVDGKPGLVIVDHNAGGVALRPHQDIDPSNGHCELILEGAPLADIAIIGHKDAAQAVARLMDVGATLNAGMMMGIAGRMLDTAVDYAKTRVQFGQPIGAFQSIKHRCADMAVAIEAGRSAVYYAFWAVAENAPDRSKASSMAKAYCGDVARQVCNETIQLHGGMGFTWELGLHRFLRRNKVLEHGFGSQTWHYERVISDTLSARTATTEQRRDAA
ncbi:acyl-CoA dehydrogenase [Sphingobium xenophagum]|uniref:Acyl-CoA dehydrogenase n=1 Tax=Sphingobium xenophagum TaxID=121428 RepID=A0A249MRY1_SPHXE|nr:acyl-CoA dehydrogenase family protein [Sphingobium xenophagum]ASY44120.1 acyl-CoA dehydrogenase [Sphingobium xenophagum]